MNLKKVSRWIILTIVATVVASMPNPVYACECETPTICVAYSEAEAVFIGMVEKVGEIDDGIVGSMDISFAVEKVYKGKPADFEVVRFSAGDCSTRFEVGNRYFVYRNPQNELGGRFCNITGKLNGSDPDLTFVNSLNNLAGEYSFFGEITGLSGDEYQRTQIWFETKAVRQKVSVDRFGNYLIQTSETADLKVNIEIPFKTIVSPKYLLIKASPEKTILEFTIKPRLNECDFRQINLQESDFLK